MIDVTDKVANGVVRTCRESLPISSWFGPYSRWGSYSGWSHANVAHSFSDFFYAAYGDQFAPRRFKVRIKR